MIPSRTSLPPAWRYRWYVLAAVALARMCNFAPILAQSFERISPDQSNVRFANHIAESDTFNIIKDFYAYNGGGVAVGDIDGDRLPDIIFTSTGNGIHVYRNRGGFRFEDVSKRSNMVDTGITCGILLADITGDGFLDAYVCRRYAPNSLYVNDGTGVFRDMAAVYGLDVNINSNNAVALDYDRDGDLDLYIVTNGEPRRQGHINPGISDRLFRNDETTFTDVTSGAGLGDKGYGLSATVSDVDNDGWPDIYVANDFEERDILYINQRDGTFKNEILKRLQSMSQFSMGSDIADINNDGYTDIGVVDMLPETHYRRMTQVGGLSIYGPFFDSTQRIHNTLQLNRGNGRFSDICFLAGIAATDWSWSILFSDFDHDGLQDIFIGNGTKRDLGDQDFIYSVRFSDTARTDGYRTIPRSWTPNYLYRNSNGLQFKNVTNASGVGDSIVANGVALADLDADGDLDIVINTTDTVAFLYRNNAVEQSLGSWVTFSCKGRGRNTDGIGARLTVWAAGTAYVRELNGARGYLSTSQHIVHVGLGKAMAIDSVVVVWPDGTTSTHRSLTARRHHVLVQENTMPWSAPLPPQRFVDDMPKSVLSFRHRENNYDDFKRERLLPYRFSRQGPGIASGDVNGDGRLDVVLTGPKYSSTSVWLQQNDATFVECKQCIPAYDESEDVDAQLADVDGDGDLDLIVITGGNEFDAEDVELEDRLYVNDGKGGFTVVDGAFPTGRHSGSSIAMADMDGDGDLDALVGGRVVPGRFPEVPRTVLLRNDGGRFVDVTRAKAPSLEYCGMTTKVVFADIDGNKSADIIVVGEWMTPRILLNSKGVFTDATTRFGLDGYEGWWTGLAVGDVDGDGDVDLICGNLGRNSRFPTSKEAPIEYVAADFDDNGSIDPLLSQVVNGKRVPTRDRNVLLTHLPTYARRYVTYRSYALASLDDLIPEGFSGTMLRGKVTTYVSMIFRNDGGKRFVAEELPLEAQIAPIYDIALDDINGDGKQDILLVGNSKEADSDVVGYEAGVGQVLLGSDRGFVAVRPDSSGWDVPGAARRIVTVADALGGTTYIVGINNGWPRVFRRNGPVRPPVGRKRP
ncbi:MAG: VCBS repeat-containing protein [Candidatus Kapabacteria bacterium]|nr:VCBS repeat-containing protein [Candidatus Kapabacteria bacterium]